MDSDNVNDMACCDGRGSFYRYEGGRPPSTQSCEIFVRVYLNVIINRKCSQYFRCGNKV